MWTLTFLPGAKAYLDLNGIKVPTLCLYSGHAEGVNNPELEAVIDVGPIPRGLWTISGPPFDDPVHGPYCLRLTPQKGTETFGRSGFLIHGDEVLHAGQELASHGCIIADPDTRRRIYQSGDTALTVTSAQL